MKLRINSRDLGYTIDTYGMFTGDSADEMELEHYIEEYELTTEEAQEIQFDYNHEGIVHNLAESSVELLTNELVTYGSGVVKNITLEGTTSPQFYNYTTDSYTAVWDVDVEKLRDELKGQQQKLEEFLREQWNALDTRDTESEDYIVAMLDFWTREQYSVDDYNMSMWEQESEIYYSNMELTKEASAIVEQAQKRLDNKLNQTELEV